MITFNQVWRELQRGPRSCPTLAELLGVDKRELKQVLDILVEHKVIAVNPSGMYGLRKPGVRPTEVRDALVLAEIRRLKRASREQIEENIPASTSAQVYTSIRRLTLMGQVKKLKTGTRTPAYTVAA
jgi:transcription initiation factor IIE alpha subunit